MSLLRQLRTLRMFAPLIGGVPTSHLWYLWQQMRFEKPHLFAGHVRINTFFPPWPSPAFGRFCSAVIARRRVPYSVYVAVTGECPCSCGHCSYGRRPGASLGRSALLDLVRQIKAMGVPTIGFTGGEPLLRPDLEDAIASAGPEMATIVFTTGANLGLARAKRLAAANVTCVTIGVESATPAEHDRVRGLVGSFAQARKAADACREAGIYLAISTVGFREKIDAGELDRLYELATDWGAGELRLLTPVATGSIAGCGSATLTDAQRQSLVNFHTQRNSEAAGPAVASFARLESDALFGCGAGYHHLFIDATGEVCPCDLTPLSFGNVSSEPLAGIWTRMGEHFALPRRGCLMAGIAGQIDAAAPLPLPREQSEKLIPPRDANVPLPEGYRRLLEQ